MFDSNTVMLFLPLVLLVVMMIFMWRNNKKMQERQAQLRSEMAVGTEVMTQAGLYGTIVDIDTEHNITTIESTPGTRLRIHSATIVNVVTPAVAVPDDASSLETPSASTISGDDALRADATDRELVDPHVEGTDPSDGTDPNAPKA